MRQAKLSALHIESVDEERAIRERPEAEVELGAIQTELELDVRALVADREVPHHDVTGIERPRRTVVDEELLGMATEPAPKEVRAQDHVRCQQVEDEHPGGREEREAQPEDPWRAALVAEGSSSAPEVHRTNGSAPSMPQRTERGVAQCPAGRARATSPRQDPGK